MLKLFSKNFGERDPNLPIDMIVIHYTGMQTKEMSISRMCDQSSEVSAHYLIDEDGVTYNLVSEKYRAWHAGVSYWKGEKDTNSRSIGIELQNPGHDWGYTSFPEVQMKALIELTKEIIDRHGISKRMVLGHSDVAPDRKLDPGHLFDWKLMAAAEAGYWPNFTPKLPPVNQSRIRDSLTKIGYNPNVSIVEIIKALQLHYRPTLINGKIDNECWGIICALKKNL